MKRILLHLCCGPCTLYPLARLREAGFTVSGLFFNPNIHPYQEFRRRLETAARLEAEDGLDLRIEEGYGLVDFLRAVVYHEGERCSLCYRMRLEGAAQEAAARGFSAFTTTLLYSRYQNHALIIAQGRESAARHGIDFHYEDFRRGWQQGIDESIRRGMYRQPYCGCIFSEQERYDPSLRKKPKAKANS